jgi:hypothetical protein
LGGPRVAIRGEEVLRNVAVSGNGELRREFIAGDRRMPVAFEA